MRWPFWAFPAGALSAFGAAPEVWALAPGAARMSAAENVARTSERDCLILRSLTWLRDDIDESWLPVQDHVDSAPDSRPEVFGICDGTLGMNAHALRQSREVDIGVIEGGADVWVGNAAIVAVGHALQVHQLLMIGAVVMHDV